MHKFGSTALGTLATLAGVFFFGCGSDEFVSGEELGKARLTIATVPPGVNCLRIEAASSVHTYRYDFSVAGGQNTVLDVSPLPLGALAFTGLAFPQACSLLTDAATPSWFSEPTSATLVENQIANLTLTMTQGSEATVNVDFTGQANCTPPEVNCFGSCADTATDESNCGSCGVTCAPGALCQQGVCEHAFEFTGGQPDTGVCGDWQTFLFGLSGSYTEVVFSSSEGPTEISCTDPQRATQICQALRTQTSVTVQCQGLYWQTRYCSGGISVGIDPTSYGVCNCGIENAMRPCAGTQSGSFGGVNHLTCGAPAQTLGIVCR